MVPISTFVSFTGALFRTTFTDPGIIPRASHDEAAYIEKQIGELEEPGPGSFYLKI